MSSVSAFAGSVPANYEKYLGPFLFEPYALDLMKRLQNRKVKNVLELACGTGRVTKHLLNLVPQDGQLVASDLNPDMIAIAKEKVPDQKIDWQVIDAQELPFSNNSFDTIVIQYGVMFFPDKLRAFSEAHRVLEAGGLMLFNSWDSLHHNPAIEIMHNLLQSEFGDAAPNFLEQGPYSFSDRKLMRQLLEDAGFSDIRLETVQIMSRYDNADVVVKGFCEGSPLAAYLKDFDSTVKERVKQKMKEEIQRKFGAQSNEVPLQAIVCEAVK
jgi:ubiquinone/menaquinone biosynthesis C-methylase UbiE